MFENKFLLERVGVLDGTTANSMGLQKNWRDCITYSSRTKPGQSLFREKLLLKNKNCEYEYFFKERMAKESGNLEGIEY